MQDDKVKQVELLVAQTAARLQSLQKEMISARQKIRQQEDIIARLRANEAEIKILREWKKNTLNTLKRLENRIEKEIAKANEPTDEVL